MSCRAFSGRIRSSIEVAMSLDSKKSFDLTPAKRALLEALLDQEDVKAATSTSIPKRIFTNSSPLSFAQQRLWFLDQLQPGLSIYNMLCAWHFKGALNLVALEHSLTEITRRHETLRASFPVFDKQPVQLIADLQPFSVPIRDLSTLPLPERTAQTHLVVREEAH